MRALLIDPWVRSVVEMDLQPGLQAMYAALSGLGFPVADEFSFDPAEWGDCHRDVVAVDCIDIRSLGGGQDLVCDDEGRLRDYQACFRFKGSELLIAGRALIVGNDGGGNTVGTVLPLQMASERIEFLPFDTDYTPPAPVVVGFSSMEMLQFMGVR